MPLPSHPPQTPPLSTLSLPPPISPPLSRSLSTDSV
jgi:hypothetical protein